VDAARHNAVAILLAVGLVAGVAALNVAVDPLGTFGSPAIEGFNALKPGRLDREREAKLLSPEAASARALVLGTSRASIGLDPDALEDLVPGAYNLATGGQSLHETRRILESLGPRLAGSDVLVGLDFFAANARFDQGEDATSRLLAQPRWRSLAAVALSLDTAGASLRTVAGQDAAAIEAAGRMLTGRGHLRLTPAYAERRGGARSMFEASERAYATEFYFPPPARRFEWRRGDRDACEDLEALFAAAHRHGIRLRAFLSPSHARQWTLVDSLGLWPEFERFKRMVVEANARAASGRAPFPVHDFAGHFPEVSAPVPAGTHETLATHWDSSHYRVPLGTMAVARAVRDAPAPPGSFGARLEASTIEEHLGRLRELRAQWRAANPAEQEAVSRIAQTSRPARAPIRPCAARRGP